jgi:hypothetical protein
VLLLLKPPHDADAIRAPSRLSDGSGSPARQPLLQGQDQRAAQAQQLQPPPQQRRRTPPGRAATEPLLSAWRSTRPGPPPPPGAGAWGDAASDDDTIHHQGLPLLLFGSSAEGSPAAGRQHSRPTKRRTILNTASPSDVAAVPDQRARGLPLPGGRGPAGAAEQGAGRPRPGLDVESRGISFGRRRRLSVELAAESALAAAAEGGAGPDPARRPAFDVESRGISFGRRRRPSVATAAELPGAISKVEEWGRGPQLAVGHSGEPAVGVGTVAAACATAAATPAAAPGEHRPVFDLESRGSSFGRRGSQDEGQAAVEGQAAEQGEPVLKAARSGSGGLLRLVRQPSAPLPGPHAPLLRAMAHALGNMQRAEAGLPLTGAAPSEEEVQRWTRGLLGLPLNSDALLALYGEVQLQRPGVKLGDLYSALVHLRSKGTGR